MIAVTALVLAVYVGWAYAGVNREGSAALSGREMRGALFMTLLLLMVSYLVFGWLLYRAVMRPLRQLTTLLDEADRTAEHPLAARADEWGRLARLIQHFFTQRAQLAQESDARQLARQAAENAAERARESERTKTDFLAMVSHELRTPVHAIAGYAALLEEEDEAEARAEYQQIIRRQAHHLTHLLDELLDLASLEAGSPPREEAFFDPQKWFRELEGIIEPTQIPEDVVLNWHMKGPFAPLVQGDAHRLQQVVTNLVENALKFTEAGAVVVEFAAGLRVPQQAQQAFTLKVRDTGIGIPRALQAKVFEPFTQGDSSATRSHGGVGLGLAIVRRIIASLQGEVSLDSTEGEGSCFTCRFSLRCVPGAEDEDGTGVVDDLVGDSPMRVLVIDDDTVSRKLLELILARLGCRVEMFARARQALEVMESQSFDLILLDSQMPEMDGLSFLEHLDTLLPLVQRPPIVMISADKRRASQQDFAQYGVVEHLGKPFLPQDLQRIVAAFSPDLARS